VAFFPFFVVWANLRRVLLRLHHDGIYAAGDCSRRLAGADAPVAPAGAAPRGDAHLWWPAWSIPTASDLARGRILREQPSADPEFEPGLPHDQRKIFLLVLLGVIATWR
jgi:hypothetical protein